MAESLDYQLESNSNPNSKDLSQLKLFGFKVYDEENSSSVDVPTPCMVTDSPEGSADAGDGLFPSEQSKYECQYCCKEFANKQALGGHQNAHKKERYRLRRAQMLAARRKAVVSIVKKPIISTFTPATLLSRAGPVVVQPGAPPAPLSWLHFPGSVSPFQVSHGCMFTSSGSGVGRPDMFTVLPHDRGGRAYSSVATVGSHQAQSRVRTVTGQSLSKFSDRINHGPSFDGSLNLDLHLSLNPGGSMSDGLSWQASQTEN
ncbi:hypothetical protein SAY86_016827 [Trapa natans]|uniref:C2H2-type domain-containing protein n=1 Tax=Trapa natans TaxID=22666 RepID=A0AAN7LJP1_TRANT|nr:hypothetical protein SAY86_016827 [Trapa natans]